MRVSSRDLRRQPVRSGLTLAALSISTVILVTLAALSLSARQAIITELSPNNSLTTITVTANRTASAVSLFGSVQEANQHTTTLDDTAVQKLTSTPHVQFAVPRAYVWEFNTFTIAGSSTQFVAKAEGVGTESADSLPVAAGQRFSEHTTDHDVILGAGYANQLGYAHNPQALIGKTVTITTQKGYRGIGAAIPGPTADQAINDQFNQTTTTLQARIVGITTTGSNQSTMFIPMDWARQVRDANYWMYDATKASMISNPARASYDELGNLKTVDQLARDGYSSIIVQADQVANVPSVAQHIDQLGYGEVSTQAVVKQFETFATIMWVILGAVALVALVAASLGIVNTMLMTVSEQRYVIGVWRACGARKGQIARQFLLQALALGFLGGVFGTAAATVISYYVNRYIVTLLTAHSLTVVSLHLPPIWLLGGGVVLTMLFSVVAGLYPAVVAARQDPSKALTAV